MFFYDYSTELDDEAQEIVDRAAEHYEAMTREDEDNGR